MRRPSTLEDGGRTRGGVGLRKVPAQPLERSCVVAPVCEDLGGDRMHDRVDEAQGRNDRKLCWVFC